LAVASLVAGSSPDLSVIRALAALMSLVLLVYFTALALWRAAPPVISRLPKGGLVDTVIGDEAEAADEETEPEADGGPEVETEPEPEGESQQEAEMDTRAA
jgi:hypothetical protein